MFPLRDCLERHGLEMQWNEIPAEIRGLFNDVPNATANVYVRDRGCGTDAPVFEVAIRSTTSPVLIAATAILLPDDSSCVCIGRWKDCWGATTFFRSDILWVAVGTNRVSPRTILQVVDE